MSTGVAVAPEVAAALARGGAVVALESTIISHGMPYPKNLQTAMEVEAIVRENGAVPATIAILDGVPHVGLSSEQLRRLAISGRQFQKTARRDIAHVVASGGNGATTVSATMFFAHKVGIPIFVTGGIGGVHRQGEQSVHYYAAMDISSDLTELGNTPVAVISAGVKSILDIPRTLEYLETQGVTVAAYKTNEFPAFFTENSGSQDRRSGTMIGTGHCRNLYVLDTLRLPSAASTAHVSSPASSFTSSFATWHHRLGHLCGPRLSIL
ncbi:pseudouridine-5'-phosphate glycosidase-like isoform X3 [Phragmites australis]|uniref:pseudouridine-5'-phosphate glycosidase-like isoform X3 n=1 Tax=Phragmites australis TaxID=29695 RepID=UPI002D78B65B|nr:pseudouridine-5'-phosphate glycosidase-like isoform X3 [Phragmites australis]